MHSLNPGARAEPDLVQVTSREVPLRNGPLGPHNLDQEVRVLQIHLVQGQGFCLPAHAGHSIDLGPVPGISCPCTSTVVGLAVVHMLRRPSLLGSLVERQMRAGSFGAGCCQTLHMPGSMMWAHRTVLKRLASAYKQPRSDYSIEGHVEWNIFYTSCPMLAVVSGPASLHGSQMVRLS